MDVLAAFAGEHGIAYDLLSDEGSAVLERLGLLNPHIAEQQAFYGRGTDERHARLPYPCTLVLDEAGTVVERLIEQSYRPRPGAGTVLRRATGAPGRGGRSATAGDGVVEVTAFTDAEGFRPVEQHELYVELRIADGWHVYTEPVPDGFVPLRVEVTTDSEASVSPPELPSGRPFEVEGLPERFFVVDGSVLVVVPLLLPGSRHHLDGRDRPEALEATGVTLDVRVGYQACSETECLPPATHHLTLDLDEDGLVRP